MFWHLENPAEEVDVDDLVRRYTSDVIASAGFGLQVNSVKDRDNEFFKIGQNLFKMSWRLKIIFLFMSVCPRVVKVSKNNIETAKWLLQAQHSSTQLW